MKTFLLRDGWRIEPKPPFVIGRLAGGDAVIAHHGTASMPKLRLSSEGGLQVALGPGTQAVEEVLYDYFDGEPNEGPGWWLAFEAGYLCPWPVHTTVWSTGDDASWPVELTLDGGRDEFLYVKGPFARSSAPELGSLVGPGMERVGSARFAGVHGAIEMIELRYTHADAEWRQWRYLVPLESDLVLLVTAQATAEGLGPMLEIGKLVCAGARSS